MGYTHYWDHAEITPADWSSLVYDARRIIAESGVSVAGGNGKGKPVLNHRTATPMISLNGADGDDYETFALDRSATGFDFCKTGARPYDLVVATILLRATLTIPGFNIRSDGEWPSDWMDARELYGRIFGPAPAECPFRGR